MDWTDLIDTAFRVAGNSNQAKQAEAVRPVEAAVIDGEQPVASTAGRHPDHFRKEVIVFATHRLLSLKDGKPPVPVPLTAVTVARTEPDGDVLTIIALTGPHRFEDVAKADDFAEQVREATRGDRLHPALRLLVEEGPAPPPPNPRPAGNASTSWSAWPPCAPPAPSPRTSPPGPSTACSADPRTGSGPTEQAGNC
ncbi:hypothetical protein [Streptomyces sp. CBMA123]|uniref:hypothetical protein n=1 Tax=Streptomyces sp. CBMA123 TaxID=1896313 RepID=UPI0016619A8A|nr:hypothetical protein [Streptomyces sp. CBMA123]MBD0694188.1 hypothetical protein [Streptomyces sp. CBMA123]